MGPIATQAGKQIATAILTEAGEEVRGNSQRKWALVLVAIGLVAAVAVVVTRWRGVQDVVGDEQWSAPNSDQSPPSPR